MGKNGIGAKHTVTARGRLVDVELVNGERFTARFKERTSGMVLIFEDGRRVPARNVKTFNHRRNRPGRVSAHRRIGS